MRVPCVNIFRQLLAEKRMPEISHFHCQMWLEQPHNDIENQRAIPEEPKSFTDMTKSIEKRYTTMASY
jgi:hypothetical protein